MTDQLGQVMERVGTAAREAATQLTEFARVYCTGDGHTIQAGTGRCACGQVTG